MAAQHEQPQEPLGGGRTMLAASVHPAPALEVQGGQPQPILRTDRASHELAGVAGPALFLFLVILSFLPLLLLLLLLCRRSISLR